MEPVSGALKLVALMLQAASELREQINHLRHNSQHRRRLLALVNTLIEKLEPLTQVSEEDFQLTRRALQSARRSLEAIAARHGRGFGNQVKSFFNSSTEHAELDEVERKLEHLMTQVVVARLVPTISAGNAEAPFKVGLHRANAVVGFLQTSAHQPFRVISFQGPAGIGKTTLLNYVRQEAVIGGSSKKRLAFKAQAYVEIGNNVQLQATCKLQSSILSQLGGGNREFPSTEIGKEQLKSHFRRLKAQNKPLFLAIDNVGKPQQLHDLLPFSLAKADLPASSCVAVTSRNDKVVQALLNICNLQAEDQQQVLCINPPRLSRNESKRMFAQCAHMDPSAPEHRELLDTVVPLCAGLPLALAAVGRSFVDINARRKSSGEWVQLVHSQLATLEHDEDNMFVSMALQVGDAVHNVWQRGILHVAHFLRSSSPAAIAGTNPKTPPTTSKPNNAPAPRAHTNPKKSKHSKGRKK